MNIKWSGLGDELGRRRRKRINSQGYSFLHAEPHPEKTLHKLSMIGLYVIVFELQKFGEQVPEKWLSITGTQEKFLASFSLWSIFSAGVLGGWRAREGWFNRKRTSCILQGHRPECGGGVLYGVTEPQAGCQRWV